MYISDLSTESSRLYFRNSSSNLHYFCCWNRWGGLGPGVSALPMGPMDVFENYIFEISVKNWKNEPEENFLEGFFNLSVSKKRGECIMRVTLPKQPMKPVWNQFSHSKWDLVWYSGGSLGLEMQWKGGAGRLGRFVFLFTLMPAHSFSPTSEFTGSSIEVKCKPEKKYKQACEKRTSKPVKSPYGVGHYCDIAVSPTRSHLLWQNPKLWFSLSVCGLVTMLSLNFAPMAQDEFN